MRCEGDGNAGVGDGGGMFVVSAWHEYVGSTRSSDIVSSASDVLGVSVVRGMRAVVGVCEMCMCLARGGVVGELIKGLGLGFTIPVNRVSVGCVSVNGLWWYMWGVGRGLKGCGVVMFV